MKAVILNSGGLDSAILAKKLCDDGYTLYSLFVDTHQENQEQAKTAARETANRYCISHYELDIDFGITPNYTENGLDKSLPNSSMVMFSLGVCYAKLVGCDECYAGSKQNVSEVYADRYNSIANENLHVVSRPQLVLPIWDKTSYQAVLDWAMAVPDDFVYTFSCRHSTPCGVCDKCVKRVEVGL